MVNASSLNVERPSTFSSRLDHTALDNWTAGFVVSEDCCYPRYCVSYDGTDVFVGLASVLLRYASNAHSLTKLVVVPREQLRIGSSHVRSALEIKEAGYPEVESVVEVDEFWCPEEMVVVVRQS